MFEVKNECEKFLFLGEHIKTWRPRYFILKDNGQFNGFKKEPTTDQDLADPLNNFTGTYYL